MSVINYTHPFATTSAPIGETPYYSTRLDPNPYDYPKPLNPFLREDLAGGSRNYQPPISTQLNRQPYNPSQRQSDQTKTPPTSQTPTQPPGYTKVHGGVEDGVSSLHAVVDWDDPDYYDDGQDEHHEPLHVTPIQGPIYLKNGSVPVVPLYSYPTVNNGTFVQIPILWTALSVALGLQIRGDYIRGVPCIKKYGQLFCPTAGNSYPLERIETFIDENKALMRRMYGDFTMGDNLTGGTKRKRSTDKPGVPDLHADPGPDPLIMGGDSYFEKFTRKTRQNFQANQTSETGRVDACESKVEIVTPYWASNSAGKIRAIVNTQHFEQAIHQEICSKARTKRCTDDCGCEQKYKWHRLLAYDPDNDCKGIFMDWFLFPSCCVCRCAP